MICVLLTLDCFAQSTTIKTWKYYEIPDSVDKGKIESLVISPYATSLPEDLAQFQNLKTLSLSGKRYSYSFSSLKHLVNLEELILRESRLDTVPKELFF